MHVCWKLTADGIVGAAAILVGAGIGVWAVFRQIRSSAGQLRSQLKADAENLKGQIEAQSANLKAQLDAEKEARKDERDQQIKSLAVALKVEIEDFRYYHVKYLQAIKEGSKTPEDRKEVVKLLDLSPFTIYQANAARIGEFEQKTARLVAHFHNLASEYLASIRRYNEILGGPCWPGESSEGKEARAAKFFTNKVSAALGPLEEAANNAINDLQRTMQAK